MKDLHFKCRPGQKDTPYRQGYHIVLICKICPYYQGDYLRKLYCLTSKCT